MNERLFSRLAARLVGESVVMASVVRTRGATPRKRGARMLVTATDSEFSVGGGLAEARVIVAARELLSGMTEPIEVNVDLSGGPEAAGVCGGQMQLVLRRWSGASDLLRAQAIASMLASGMPVALRGDDLGRLDDGDLAMPNERLLIIGAGHCGLALYELAVHLDFDLWIFDDAPGRLSDERFPRATQVGGDYERLAGALVTGRRVHAVLLNRDFHADVAALRVLAQTPPAFISMMGSARRVEQVRAALPGFANALRHLSAPVGLDIGAETPHEIAVSILAQLVTDRHTDGKSGEGLSGIGQARSLCFGGGE